MSKLRNILIASTLSLYSPFAKAQESFDPVIFNFAKKVKERGHPVGHGVKGIETYFDENFKELGRYFAFYIDRGKGEKKNEPNGIVDEYDSLMMVMEDEGDLRVMADYGLDGFDGKENFSCKTPIKIELTKTSTQPEHTATSTVTKNDLLKKVYNSLRRWKNESSDFLSVKELSTYHFSEGKVYAPKEAEQDRRFLDSCLRMAIKAMTRALENQH